MVEDKSQVPVDRGWAWMIVVGYFVSVFCMVGIAKSFGILLQEFVSYFNIPVAIGALAMGVCGGVYTVAAPICVTGGQHITQRRVVVIGGIVGGIGLSMCYFLFSIEYIIVMFGVFYGIGNACIFGNGLVMIGHYFSKRRSLANGLSLSGASVGQFALPPVLQYLLDNYSLNGTFLIIGAFYLNVIACGLLYRPPAFYSQRSRKHKPEEDKLIVKENGDLPDQSKTYQKRDKTDAKELNSPDMEFTTKLMTENVNQSGRLDRVLSGSVDSLHIAVVEIQDQSNKMVDSPNRNRIGTSKFGAFCKNLLDFSVLKNYVVILFVCVSFLAFFGHFNFIQFMPLSAFSKGAEKYEKAYLVSITGLCDLCGRILVGVAGDLNIVARYKILAVSILITGINIFIFAFANNFWWMAVHVGLYGFFGGCYVAINAPVLIDLVGLKQMPKVLGVVLFIQGLGAALGQPILGAIRDKLGNYEVVNQILSSSMVVSSIFLFSYPFIKKLEERDITKQATGGQNMELSVQEPA